MTPPRSPSLFSFEQRIFELAACALALHNNFVFVETIVWSTENTEVFLEGTVTQNRVDLLNKIANRKKVQQPTAATKKGATAKKHDLANHLNATTHTK